MQQYVNQLLEDLNVAKQMVPEPVNYSLLYPETNVPEGLEYVLEWEHAESYDWLYWTELDKSVFPPIHRLTTAQTKAIIQGIMELWEAFNVVADFPEAFPIERQYALLIDYWTEKVPCYHHGTLVMDWCSGYAPDCSLKEHCSCLEFWDELDDDDMDELENSL